VQLAAQVSVRRAFQPVDFYRSL